LFELAESRAEAVDRQAGDGFDRQAGDLAAAVSLATAGEVPYALERFSQPVWAAPWAPPTAQFQELAVGRLPVVDGVSQSVDPSMGLPVTVDVLSRNVVVTYEGPDHADVAHQVASALVFRALASSRPGHLTARLVDLDAQGRHLGPLLALDSKLTGGRPVVRTNELADLLTGLQDRAAQVNAVLGPAQLDFVSYKQAHVDYDEPHELVLVSAAVAALRDTTRGGDLVDLLRTGPHTGTTFVCVLDLCSPLPHGLELADLTDGADRVELCASGDVWLHTPGARFTLPVQLYAPPEPELVRSVSAAVAEAVSKAADQPVSLAGLFDPEPHQRTSMDVLDIPLGVTLDNQPASLRIGDRQDAAVGGLLVAPSGAGKSVLLHGLIHSAAYHYHPDELELYLIDLKQGVEFNEYSPLPDRPALPNVRLVARDVDAVFALACVEHLVGEIERRAVLFKDAADETGDPVADVATYRLSTGRSLPRILVVIDEFQQLVKDGAAERGWQALETIARQGRSHGVHLLVSTQKLDSVGSGFKSQANTVYAQLGLRVVLGMTASEIREVFDDSFPVPAVNLSRRGRALVNHHKGDPDDNVVCQVGVLDVAERAELRDRLAELDASVDRPLRSFKMARSTPLQPLLDDPLSAGSLPSGSAVLGEPLEVSRGRLVVSLDGSDGRGLVLVSRSPAQAVPVVLAAAAGLCASSPSRRLVLVVPSRLEATVEPFLGSLAKASGVVPEVVGPSDVPALLAAGVPDGVGDTSCPVVVVVGGHLLGDDADGLVDVFDAGRVVPVVWLDDARRLSVGPLRSLGGLQVRVAAPELSPADMDATLDARVLRAVQSDCWWLSDLGSPAGPVSFIPAVVSKEAS
jgi:hypothetical protein